MKDKELPEKLSLYGGIVEIPIRPFVDSVVQCFQCYKFGHLREKYRGEKKCIICGKGYHGHCSNNKRYVNCGKEHKANDRSCSEYKKKTRHEPNKS